MEGKGIRWLAFCAGLGTGYTLGLATYRWLWYQGDHQLITSIANSLQALRAEVSHLRQALGETGTVGAQLREIQRATEESTRMANTVTREVEEEEESFYEAASFGRCCILHHSMLEV